MALKCEQQLRLVLHKIAITDNIKNECLEIFLKQIKWELNQDLNISVTIFTEWITEAVKTGNLTNPNLISFTFNLAELLLKNEDRFNELNRNNFLTKLQNFAKQQDSAKLKIAYTKFLLSFLEHKSGLEWITACNAWEDIYWFCLTDFNPDVIEESVGFLVKILDKTYDYNETFCEEIIKEIMLPITEIFKSIQTSDDISDKIALELQPTLKLIGNILEKLLRGVCFAKTDFNICFVFLKFFCLEERICDFMLIAQKKFLVFDLSKIMFLMEFVELYGKIITKMISLDKVTTTINRIQVNFMGNLCLGNFEDQMDFCNFGIFFWKLVNSKIHLSKFGNVNNDVLNLHDELLLFLRLPTFCILLKYFIKFSDLEQEMDEDQFRDAFSQDMMDLFSMDFMRICFYWRNKVVDNPNLFQLAVKSFQLTKLWINYLSRDQAVFMFKTLIYLVRDIVWNSTKNQEKINILIGHFDYVCLLFEILGIIIDKFHIVLKDGIEATYVMSLCFDFLMLLDWSVEVIVQVFKLIDIALAHYMAPNMALLVEDSTDPTLAMLGPIIYSRLFHQNPIIRKAALDVIHTAANISNKKFPSLQKVLMDSELPTLVVKMSANDSESFVRATAIKCLQEMIQVEEIWNNALKSEDLTQKMRQILINETEGIVRVEAATFMCVAYEHQQFPKNTLEEIYETMIYSSTTDLHWEVKVRALEFWDKVIKNHLQNQGMIDGTFPNVTFSKEHRKIVTLTDSEIRKRLLKVLNQLSSIGCLGVLTSAIKDDCDMEVAKTAVKITQRLVDLFKKYNVRSNYSTPTSPTPTENCMSATVSLSSGISVDEFMDSPSSTQPDFNEDIIEQIVNTKDVNLLRNVYSPSDYGSVSNYDIQVRKIINPNEFLQFTQQDLNNVITEKKKWLNGIEDLGSLLDDMLKTYDDDVNNMDCY